MPTYIETQDVTKPAGTRDRSLGDDDIREFKRAECERQNEDHVRPADETGETLVGYHRKVQLYRQTSDPAAVALTGIAYTKDIGAGVIELFYEDAAGNVIQLTSAGKLMALGTNVLRTGDKLLSSNTNTPTGWTDESTTYDDKFIRLSKDTPLDTGGANTHDHGAATGSHTLTSAEVPSHSHTFAVNQAAGGGSNTSVYNNVGASETGTLSTSSSGSGGGHTHTVASADNVPAYIQLKIYSKN